MQFRVSLCAVVVALLATSCSSPLEPMCSGTLGVTVDPGPVPTFRWSGSCGVTTVTVIRSGTNQVVWQIEAIDERSPIGDPTHYGRRPSNAKTLVTAAGLEIGAGYRVDVIAIVGGDAIAATGTTMFTFQQP